MPNQHIPQDNVLILQFSGWKEEKSGALMHTHHVTHTHTHMYMYIHVHVGYCTCMDSYNVENKHRERQSKLNRQLVFDDLPFFLSADSVAGTSAECGGYEIAYYYKPVAYLLYNRCSFNVHENDHV